VATLSDTVVVRLASGYRRVIMLSGLDYPYGYVLIEPGYAEEFHTGVDAEEDLKAALDDYFGLEEDTPRPRHRIAGAASNPRAAPLARFATVPFPRRLTSSRRAAKVPTP
jgi:hypothetical protein